MAIPSEHKVREVLREYEPVLVGLYLQAWDDVRQIEAQQPRRYSRTRSNDVSDRVIQLAAARFEGDAGVWVVEKNNTAFFIFAGGVCMKFKKGDRQGRTRNIRTAAVDCWNDPDDYKLFGGDLMKVECVYVVNRLRTMIDSIRIQTTAHKRAMWSYEIGPGVPAVEQPLFAPTPLPAPRTPLVRPRIEAIPEPLRRQEGQ